MVIRTYNIGRTNNRKEEVVEIKLGYEQRRGGRVKERQKETKREGERERERERKRERERERERVREREG